MYWIVKSNKTNNKEESSSTGCLFHETDVVLNEESVNNSTVSNYKVKSASVLNAAGNKAGCLRPKDWYAAVTGDWF